MHSIGAAANGDSLQQLCCGCHIGCFVHRIQRCNLRRGNIVNFSHTSRSSISTPFLHCYSPQTVPSLRRSPPKSNTPIPSPTPLTTQNGTQIQSAVFPPLTRQMGQVKPVSHKRSALQGGPRKVKPITILLIFGRCKLHTTRNGAMQILSKFCHNKHLTR